MQTRRIVMDVIEDVLRMRHGFGRSQREISSAWGLSVGAVNRLPQRGSGESEVAVAGGPGRGRHEAYRRARGVLREKTN